MNIFFTLFLASASKCWNCTNIKQPFCGEHLDSSKLSSEVKTVYYTECPDLLQKCMKMQIDVNVGGKFQSFLYS